MTEAIVIGERTIERRWIVAGLCLVVTGAAFCGAVVPHSDVSVYQHYAKAMLRGPLSAGLPKEYPALAGGVFAALASVPLPYLFAIELVMAGSLVCLIAAGVRVLRSSAWAQRTLIYLVLGAGTLMFTRFDLLPATFGFLALLCARRNRFGWAWALAAAGASLKLFPALLLPGFFVYEWRLTGRQPWRRVAATVTALGGLALVQALVVPGTLMNPFRYEIDRGFEMYSVPGSLTTLLNPLHLHWRVAYGGWQVSGPGYSGIGHLTTAVEVLLALATWRAIFNRRLSLEAGSLAILSLAILTDRALAPQYLIWLAPLWALWPTRRGWVAASALTFLTYPVSMGIASEFRLSLLLPTVMGLVRNVVLVAATAGWVREELQLGKAEVLLLGAHASRQIPERARTRRIVFQPVPAVVSTKDVLHDGRKADV
jgi:hypothetical protein